MMMDEWLKTTPPIGEEIEFRDDAGGQHTGILASAGSFGIGNTPQEAADRKPLFRFADGDRAFRVLEWRKP